MSLIWTDALCPCNWIGITCNTSLDSCAGVTQINLQGRGITASNLPALDNLQTLTVFNISDNYISGTLASLPSLPALAVFDVSNNLLTGNLTRFINNISSNVPLLAHINLASNALSGTLPSLSGLKHLASVDFANNSFSGTMTAFLSNLPPIKSLDLSNNALSGALPVIPSLLKLNLANNTFTGSIPAALLATPLTTLNLMQNILSGVIPPASNPGLSFCDISGNFFYGAIPDFLLAIPTAFVSQQDGYRFNCPISAPFNQLPCAPCGTPLDTLAVPPVSQAPLLAAAPGLVAGSSIAYSFTCGQATYTALGYTSYSLTCFTNQTSLCMHPCTHFT